MMFRNAVRFASKAVARNEKIVPDVLVSLGARKQKMTFISHPGVMAVAKLLEMNHLTKVRANLTQENVDAIKQYDMELGEKAQVAVDNELPINFLDLEYIDKKEYLHKLLEEKNIVEEARKETFALPEGLYPVLKSTKDYHFTDAPRHFRPELQITTEMEKTEKELRELCELNKLVDNHISKTSASISK